jgi:DNA-binding MarR family transcriptional regulator
VRPPTPTPTGAEVRPSTPTRTEAEVRPPTPTRTEAVEAVGHAFKAAASAVRRLRGRETHRHDELSYAQYGLLFGLYLCEGQSLRELALAAGVSPASAVEMLDGLAASGLVTRTRSADDKRIVLSSLTPRGRAVIEQRRARYEPRWRAALERFSEDELETASAVLDAIRQFFDELDEGES